MSDQWYFDIGDGKTYGPYPLEKLQKWAESGNLMPTHRVRKADSSEWMIAANIPGLERTTEVIEATSNGDPSNESKAEGKGFKKLVRGLARKKSKRVPVSEAGVVQLCDELLDSAFQRNASDIHLDPEERIVLVQFRIDGDLETIRKVPKAMHSAIVTRFKVLANMDIAERRLPQDGRFVCPLGPQGRRVSIRAACLPTTHGERLTLRLLALDTEGLTLNRLGMSQAAYQTFTRYAGQRQGMILLTGPTGSGKSTTLYGALRHRLANYPGRIITVEDPVEFDVVGVAQSEIDSGDKLRFDTALRTILRSDPDVIMIGEIRDFDSLDIAVKAALTGHLVLSSLHANSAAGVVTRLIDMGILPFQVAATLRLCISHRLVRRLCPGCRKARPMTAVEAHAFEQPKLTGATVYDPGRCTACEERGYRGRVGLFELLPIDDELAARIVLSCNEADLVATMRQRQLPSLRDDGLEKALAGITSVDDVIAVTSGIR